MAEQPLALELAGRVSALVAAPLPARSLALTRLLLADQLGVQIRGATLANVAPVAALVARAGGAAQATVANGGRTGVGYAAYANGTFGHACQYDDSHPLAWHPGSCVIPAALAVLESEGGSGADLADALVAGTEVMAWLGAATTPAMQQLGWHGAKVLGVIGAAVGAGVALRLPDEQLAQAIAVAASDASGTMEYDHGGGEVKRMHTGSAARSGCEAALLARDGMTAPLTALDGAKGVLALIARVDLDTARQTVEEAATRAHLPELIFRLHPTVGTVHAPLDAIATLMQEHGFTAADVVRIRIGLAEYALHHGAAITRPHDMLSAQFSLAFSCGLLLARGADRAADYLDPARWTDPDVLALADRVEAYATTFPPDHPMLSARVDIDLRDGRHVDRVQRGFRGHPTNPATPAELEDKFRANLAGLRAERDTAALWAAATTVDQLPDVSALTAVLGSG